MLQQMKQIEKAISFCRDKHDSVWSLLEGTELPAKSIRDRLMHGYASIILEHNESIILLIQRNLPGSAATLIRPLYETLIRCVWVNGCATKEQILDISVKTNFRFPKCKKMLIDISDTYSGEPFSKLINEGIWKSMCGYTHSGLQQLSRRFSNNGKSIVACYREGELLEMLYCSTMFMLFAVHLLFKSIVLNTDAVNMLEKMLEDTFKQVDQFT